jgi:hypothetical protein
LRWNNSFFVGCSFDLPVIRSENQKREKLRLPGKIGPVFELSLWWPGEEVSNIQPGFLSPALVWMDKWGLNNQVSIFYRPFFTKIESVAGGSTTSTLRP